ncbi:hypothetical protein NHQ30_006038 [Ciborinia camelliae]|nr:hypothetical protein NHQ30_006038 [Ciborinia camelliae]
MASYLYTPINSHELQIRVLHILPRSYIDPQSPSPSVRLSDQGFPGMSCTLHVVSLKDSPEYHALSYCWGDPSLPRAKILLDEVEVEVTISLEQALKAFQHETKPMIFWIDAICINQNDPNEKAEQIKLMKDIYSCASIVDVFLGSGTPGTDEAMEAAQRIGEAAYDAGILSITVESMRDCELYIRDGHEGYGFNRPKTDDPLADVKRSLYQLAMDIGTNFPYAGWSEIGRRDYWNRLWIMQEFCLGKELMITCGKRTMPFHRCFEAAWLFLIIQANMVVNTHGLLQSANDPAVEPILRGILMCFESSPSAGPLLGARKQHRNSDGSNLTNLVNLLERCCLKESKDLVRKARYPRDLIYGLLGMAADAKLLNIQPVYTNIDSDEETVEIFTSVTRTLLKHGNIDILAWCQQPKSLLNLPSWVPDFTSITLKPSCETKKAALFCASGQSSFSIISGAVDMDPRFIELKGVRVDIIRNHGSLFTVDNTSGIVKRGTEEYLSIHAIQTRYFEEIKSFCEQAQNIHSFGTTPTSQNHPKWSEGYWRIPCADQADKYVFRTRATDASLTGYKDIRRSIEVYSEIARNMSELHLSAEELNSRSAEHITCIKSAEYTSYKNAMAYQQNRRPFISEEGYVGLIPGHSRPGDTIIIILGAVQPFVVRRVGNDRWELIGEAYVHGIMDGEFMQSDFQTEDFVLC